MAPQNKDQYQYIKLPDGSYGKFAADADDKVIRAAIEKDFPDAFKGTKSTSPVPSFLSRTVSRIGSNISQPLEAAGKVAGDIASGQNPLRGVGTLNPAQEKELFPWGTGTLGTVAGGITYPYRQLGSMIGEDIHDPAKLTGDVTTAAILHEAGGGQEGTEIRRAGRVTEQTVQTAAKTDASARNIGRTIPDELLPENIRKLSPEQRAKYAEKIDKVNRAHADKLAAAARKEGLERDMNIQTRDVQNNLMSTARALKEHLDTRWNSLRETMKGATVSTPESIYNGVQSAEREFLRGSPGDLQQFRNLLREIKMQDFAEREDGTLEAISNPDAKPLDWETARVHSSAIGDRLAAGNLPGNVYQALKYVHDKVLEPALEKAATDHGHGSQYTNLKNDWSNYMRDWRDMQALSAGGSPIARVLKSTDAGFARPVLTGSAGERMMQTLERYQKFGADPELVRKVRSMYAESKAPVIKAPDVPDPEAPDLPRGMRIAGRMAGKIGGMAAGSTVGHPFLGFAAGGEAGEALIRKWWEARHPRPGI